MSWSRVACKSHDGYVLAQRYKDYAQAANHVRRTLEVDDSEITTLVDRGAFDSRRTKARESILTRKQMRTILRMGWGMLVARSARAQGDRPVSSRHWLHLPW